MLLVLLALPWAVTAVSSWTFLAGDTQSYSSGSAVLPGARRSATCWVDSRTNRLVLFGGQGVDSESDEDMLLNDVWAYDLGAQSWQKLGGSTVGNVRSSPTTPGSRRGASVWRLSDGSVYLFGGRGLSTAGVPGDLSDMWLYQNGAWQFLGTSEGQLSYVPVDEVATFKWPGARRGAHAFVDANDAMYLWGGFGVGSVVGQSGQLGDLWRYRPATNRWEHVAGPRTINAAPVYGTLGVAAPSNLPPPRTDAAVWSVDTKLYLFGGFGADGFYNDVWMFEEGAWTWIAGQSGPQQMGVAGNVPSSRHGATAQVSVDKTSALIFGGFSQAAGPGHFNELWRFDMSLRTFSLVSGRSGPNWTSNGCTKGTPSPGVVLGGRARSCSWMVPASDEFVVFGGTGLAAQEPTGYLNDLYSFRSFSLPITDLCNGRASVQLGVAATTTPNVSVSGGDNTTVIIVATVVCVAVILISIAVVLLIYRNLRQRQAFTRPVISTMSPSSPSSPTSPQHLIINQMTQSAVDLRALRSTVSPRRALDFGAVE